MFKDITIGQYYPVDSLIHRLDPRTKILFTLVFMIMLFVINNIWGYLIATVFLITVIALSRIPIKTIFSGLKAIILIIIITVVLNLFMTPGETIEKIGPLTITREGVRNSIFLAVRLIYLIVGTNIMTLTTSPIDLTDGTERIMRYVPFLKHYAHEIAMMMSIALRFIPTLIEETDKIMKAQKARGADLDSGNLFKRAKALIPILIPLFVSAFHRADELATAMEARCYRGGEKRTRLKELEYKISDIVTYVVMFIFIGALIASRFIPIKVWIF